MRFIVMLRDPVTRAFSEWSMFSDLVKGSWNWDVSKKEFPDRMNQLVRADATLHSHR